MRNKFDPQNTIDVRFVYQNTITKSPLGDSQPGTYYVTIVAWQREPPSGVMCLFGEVVSGEMRLTGFGLVAKQQWGKLPKRFPNIELGALVVMPNHMHGIIMIMDGRGTAGNRNDHDGELSRRAPTREQFQKPVKGSVPTIIRLYKSAVAYRINLMRGTKDIPVWQRNYYEHIIRNEQDLQNKTDYIEANPML